jgi:hypothetical protein
MKITAEEAFAYVMGIAGMIVQHDREINPQEAVERAGQVMMQAKSFADAWEKTHDEDGNMKNPRELLASMQKRGMTPEQQKRFDELKAAINA